MVQKDLSSREKILLQLLSDNPHLTNEELSQAIGFKYAEYVATLRKRLREREYLIGPYMRPDLGKIFKNHVRRVHAFIMFDRTYDSIRSVLREIDCWITFYPLEEGIFGKYIAIFLNTDVQKLKRIFDFLQQQGIIRYYHLFHQEDRWKMIYPTFLINGKETPNEPNFDHLLDEIPLSDLKCGSFANVTLNKVARILVMQLWRGAGKCDLRKIVRIEKKFRSKRRKELKELLKKEKWEIRRKEFKAELKELKGDLHLTEFREAYQMLINYDVLDKFYFIWPFPFSKCSQFIVFLRCESQELTKRTIFNFGRNTRISCKVSMVKSMETKEWFGAIYAAGDPFLEKKLMTTLDRYPEIVDRKLFPIRSYPPSYFESRSPPVDMYYHNKTQTLDFPYNIFYKRVKQWLEEHEKESFAVSR
ncbi:MAG: hypothetical protein PVF58_00835 [Candidatus Methanofastidiosia archaeon]